jgi:Xaa-Pro dipeptidase
MESKNTERNQAWAAAREALWMPKSERDHRYAKLRAAMAKADIDCLVVCGVGGSWMYEGNLRYLLGDRLRCNPQIDFVVFPLEGEVTLILDYGSKKHLAGKSWTDRVVAPSDPRGKDYRNMSHGDRGVSVADIVRESGCSEGRIGILTSLMPTVSYLEMQQGLPRAQFVDCAALMLQVRSIKTPGEIALIRKSAEIADAAYLTACNYAAEGVLEHQLVAKWQHTAIMEGCERSFDMVWTDPVAPFSVGFPAEQKLLRKGDTVCLEISPVFSGYFSQMVRNVTIGKMNPQLADMAKVCYEANTAGYEILKPGVRAGEIARTIEGIVRSAGYTPMLRCGHTSVGLDLLEIPMHPDDETLLEPGMAIILHPNAGAKDFKKGDPAFLGPGDTYVITDTGAERLNKSSQDLFAV